MITNLFDLPFPSASRLEPEVIYRQLELASTRLQLNPTLSRRFLRVGMELAQNIQSHRNTGKVGLLRARLLEEGILITSFNFASGRVSEKLEKKFHHILSGSDIRSGLRTKLSERMSSVKENSGDFGLDLCLLQSKFHRIKRIPVEKELYIVFQSFFLSPHEKSDHPFNI